MKSPRILAAKQQDTKGRRHARPSESGIAAATRTANDVSLALHPAPPPADLLGWVEDGRASAASQAALACGVQVVREAVTCAEAPDSAPELSSQGTADFVDAGRAWIDAVTGGPRGAHELAKASSIALTLLVRPSYDAIVRRFASLGVSQGVKLPSALCALMFAVDAADRMLRAAAMVG